MVEVPGTTRKHPYEPPLPCSGHRGAPAPFYLSHSPSLRRLKHRELSPPAPGSRPAATDLPALVMIVLHFVTSVQGCYPSRFGHAVRPSFRSGVVSSSAVSGAEISGGRNQRLPLTQSAATHTSSAPSRRCSYQQALAGLSWLSFSPPEICSGRRGGSSPVSRVVTD